MNLYSLSIVFKNDYIQLTTYEKINNVGGYVGAKATDNERFASNLARAKREIKDILDNNLNNTSSFLTLTYADNQQDYQQALKDFNKFAKRVKYNLNDFDYLRIVEHQKRGAIHFHLVTFNKEIYNLTSEQLAQFWVYGFVYKKDIDIIDVDTISKITNYLGGYFGKKEQLAKSNKKIFSVGGNIKRTQIIKKRYYNFSDYSKVINELNYNIEIPLSITTTKYLISNK